MRLLRSEFRDDGIIGTLYNEQGDQLAVTLEHAYDGQPKLPAGHYLCKRGKHQLKHSDPFETFEVTGVTGHTGILFHTGNWNKDSDGCILLGRTVTGSTEGWMITNSHLTFAYFMHDLVGVDAFLLTVLNGVEA